MQYRVSNTILTLSTFQQFCIAASTYLMIHAAMRIERIAMTEIITDIVVFFLLLSLAYIVGVTNNYALRVEQNRKWFGYCDHIYHIVSQNILATKNKNKIHNWLISESHEIIIGNLEFQKNSYEIYLNIFLNIIAINTAIGSEIIFIILFSIATGFMIFYASKGTISRLSGDVQQRKMALFTEMGRHIDRSVFTPKNDASAQKDGLHGLFAGYRGVDQRYRILESIPSVTMIVTASLVVWTSLKFNFIDDLESVIGMVVATPRIVQIFQYANDAFTSASKFYYFKIRIRNLKKFAQDLDETQCIPHLSDKITINGAVLGDARAIVRSLADKTKGRFTISGPNGAGKSTVLKILKQELDKAVLLTPENINNLTEDAGSTGQTAKSALYHYMGRRDLTAVLLDEWDANLDGDSTARIDHMLETISMRMLVVEVRH